MDREESSDSESVGALSECEGETWGLFGDWGLNWGLRCVPCSNLRPLRCHPCACKLFRISFPLNS